MLGILTLVASGCTPTPTQSSDPAPPLANVATYDPIGEGGDGALLNGTVSEVDPCVEVTDDLGTKYIPVFPRPDIEVSGDIASFRGVQLVAGADVSLTGGALSTTPDYAALPAGCTGTFWIVAQSG